MLVEVLRVPDVVRRRQPTLSAGELIDLRPGFDPPRMPLLHLVEPRANDGLPAGGRLD